MEALGVLIVIDVVEHVSILLVDIAVVVDAIAVGCVTSAHVLRTEVTDATDVGPDATTADPNTGTLFMLCLFLF